MLVDALRKMTSAKKDEDEDGLSSQDRHDPIPQAKGGTSNPKLSRGCICQGLAWPRQFMLTVCCS